MKLFASTMTATHDKKKNIKESRFLGTLTQCRLCRQVTGAVFIAILIIEAFILFFSVGNYERDRLLEIEREGLAVAKAWLQIASEHPEDLARQAPIIGIGSVLISAEVQDQSGTEIAYLKQNSILAPSIDIFYADWGPDELGYPLTIRAALDRSEIPAQVEDFVWRIVGLVLMISVFVTVITILILERLMLNPIRMLSNQMKDACTDLSSPPDKYKITGLRNDELGDVGQAYNDLLSRLSDAFNEIRYQQHNLLENNERLETMVCERTNELNKTVQELRREAKKRENVEMALDASYGEATAESLHKLAYMDTLTGLANRDLFMDRCDQILRQLKVNGTQAAIHLIDLNKFNVVNETFGQTGGDEVLQVVADRLKGLLNPSDTIARLSGDQFVVIQMDAGHSDHAAVYAQKIVDEIEKTIPINDDHVDLHASIGISMIPEENGTVEGVMDHLGLALKTAKTRQNSCFHFFNEEMNLQARDRQSMERDLKHAIEKNELSVYYQPKLCVKTGNISGMEALVRWHHPERGFVSPADFIPVAERSLQIIEIGEWVLREAARHARDLHTSGLGDFKVAVNVSAVQLREISMVALVRQVLLETGLPAHLLELELTESAVMDDVEKTISILEELRALGVSLSIDDFGTGYSSLNYLKRFPVKRIKIDKAFVDEIEDETSEGVIARAVITMGHSLGMEITAEGVEYEGQLNFLKKQGCDEIQGYLFGKPMDKEAFVNFAESHSEVAVAAQ